MIRPAFSGTSDNSIGEACFVRRRAFDFELRRAPCRGCDGHARSLSEVSQASGHARNPVPALWHALHRRGVGSFTHDPPERPSHHVWFFQVAALSGRLTHAARILADFPLICHSVVLLRLSCHHGVRVHLDSCSLGVRVFEKFWPGESRFRLHEGTVFNNPGAKNACVGRSDSFAACLDRRRPTADARDGICVLANGDCGCDIKRA